MRYLLDTDICIYFLKGKYRIIDKIKEVGRSNCFISEITIAELKYGAEKSQDYERHSKEAEQMEELFTVLPIYDCFDRYAKERVRLQRNGTLIPDFDLLIGVTSIENELIMVTNNEKHLSRLNGIKIENWIKPLHNNFL